MWTFKYEFLWDNSFNSVNYLPDNFERVDVICIYCYEMILSYGFINLFVVVLYRENNYASIFVFALTFTCVLNIFAKGFKWRRSAYAYKILSAAYLNFCARLKK